jgi:hypothetical protein
VLILFAARRHAGAARTVVARRTARYADTPVAFAIAAAVRIAIVRRDAEVGRYANLRPAVFT